MLLRATFDFCVSLVIESAPNDLTNVRISSPVPAGSPQGSRHISVASSVASQFTLYPSEFPSEFARFVDFIGGNELEEALRRVSNKLSSLRPSIARLYRDRFFFHQQCTSFTYGFRPFQLDPSNHVAVRAASLIGGINVVRSRLAPAATIRLRKMCLASLRPDRDIRQLEHEIRCFTHFGQKECEVTFADLEGKGRFDLLCESQLEQFEVECKTVSEDTGSQIKSEMTVTLCDGFDRTVRERLHVNESGLFVLRLKRPVASCRNLLQQLKVALNSENTMGFDGTDFDLAFLPRPDWTRLIQSTPYEQFRSVALSDPELQDHAHFVTKLGNFVIGLVLRPHKPATLSERVTKVLKEAADQCSGSKISLVWLHIIGFAEEEFLKLAEFSMESGGGGLNALVQNSFHPQASRTDRRHVHSVRFSADASGITTRPTLDRDRMIVRAASVSGPCYDIPNPFCRFTTTVDF
jgi:hypothetical protein